jgi:hypothetical protein
MVQYSKSAMLKYFLTKALFGYTVLGELVFRNPVQLSNKLNPCLAAATKTGINKNWFPQSQEYAFWQKRLIVIFVETRLKKVRSQQTIFGRSFLNKLFCANSVVPPTPCVPFS